MKLRIIKTDKGFITQIQKRTWYGKKYWTHYCSVYGMPDEPWYYSTWNNAINGLLLKVKSEVIINSGIIDTTQTLEAVSIAEKAKDAIVQNVSDYIIKQLQSNSAK